MSDTNTEELDDLLTALCDGTITAEDFARLESMLAAEESARRRFVIMMELHADLAYSDGALRMMHDQDGTENAPVPIDDQDEELHSAGRPLRRLHWASKAAMIALIPALTIGLMLAWNSGWFAPHPQGETAATYSAATDARYRITDKHGAAIPRSTGRLESGHVLQLESGSAEMTFGDGSQVTIRDAAKLHIHSSRHATLEHGSLTAFVPPQAVGFTVQTPDFRIVDLGTRFAIQTTGQGGSVQVLEGRVEVIPNQRLPRLYLNFDTPPDARMSFIDPISGTAARIERQITHQRGVIGDGALAFDNEADARLNLGNGGGSEIGTGLFAVRDGITLETLIIPRWSGKGWSTRTAANPDGKPYDYDQIFRKEDGDRRIVLSFQDDNGAGQKLSPIVDPGPCLTFGIYLENDGYSELDMPLDGQAGRPTLAQLQDGKPHHLVATYDAATGIKAIYIDGTLRFRHRLTPAGKVVSGGSAIAVLGNSPIADEAFAGVIDEFAFYDFALTPAEIAHHWRNVQAGRNYFGGAALRRTVDTTAAVILLDAGQSLRIDGDSKVPVTADPSP